MFSIKFQMQVIPLSWNLRDKNRGKICAQWFFSVFFMSFHMCVHCFHVFHLFSFLFIFSPCLFIFSFLFISSHFFHLFSCCSLFSRLFISFHFFTFSFFKNTITNPDHLHVDPTLLLSFAEKHVKKRIKLFNNINHQFQSDPNKGQLNPIFVATTFFVAVCPFLTVSHRFSPFLTVSHRFSPFLTVSHRFSPFLTQGHTAHHLWLSTKPCCTASKLALRPLGWWTFGPRLVFHKPGSTINGYPLVNVYIAMENHHV